MRNIYFVSHLVLPVDTMCEMTIENFECTTSTGFSGWLVLPSAPKSCRTEQRGEAQRRYAAGSTVYACLTLFWPLRNHLDTKAMTSFLQRGTEKKKRYKMTRVRLETCIEIKTWPFKLYLLCLPAASEMTFEPLGCSPKKQRQAWWINRPDTDLIYQNIRSRFKMDSI